RPLSQRRRDENAPLRVDLTAMRGADEEVLELKHVWIEAVELEQLLLELQPRRNRICLEKPRRAQRMRREEDRGISRHLNQIAKGRGHTDSPFRIDHVVIVSTKHALNPLCAISSHRMPFIGLCRTASQG